MIIVFGVDLTSYPGGQHQDQQAGRLNPQPSHRNPSLDGYSIRKRTEGTLQYDKLLEQQSQQWPPCHMIHWGKITGYFNHVM